MNVNKSICENMGQDRKRAKETELNPRQNFETQQDRELIKAEANQ